VIGVASMPSSCLVEQPGRDVAHVCLLELVVLAVHAVDTDVLECGDNCWDIEAHGDESIDEIFVVAVVPAIPVSLLYRSAAGSS
jgi:hypothetical protein